MIGETPSPPRAGRVRALVVVLARQGFDPGLAGVEAAGEVAQQIEGLGQHVLARHRLELGHVERGQDFAQRLHGRRLRRAVVAGRRLDRVAGVEQHGAALLHVGVDLVDGVLRRLRRARHDRPVDQREEGEFVMRGIDADGIAGLERGALRQEQRQSGHAGLDDGIDVGIAGDDIGEAGLRHRLHRELVGRAVRARRRAARAQRCRAAISAEDDHAPARRGGAAARRGRRRAPRR